MKTQLESLTNELYETNKGISPDIKTESEKSGFLRKIARTTKYIGLVGLAYTVLTVAAEKAKATLFDSNSIEVDGIEYYMQTDKAVYNLGEDVDMLYRVTNLGSKDVRFDFSDQVQHYFEVTSNNDTMWWRPWAGEPAASYFVLQPNRYKEYTETWNQMDEGDYTDPTDDIPVLPGYYEITGSLHPILLVDKDQYVPVSVNIDIIPEPATIALLGTGFLGLLAYKRNNHDSK